MIKYKAEWHDKKLIQVSKVFPSSKLCNCCGYKKEDLTLTLREWTCPKCGTKHDRDINAAITILNEVIRINNTMYRWTNWNLSLCLLWLI
jgi:putative transposase